MGMKNNIVAGSKVKLSEFKGSRWNDLGTGVVQCEETVRCRGVDSPTGRFIVKVDEDSKKNFGYLSAEGTACFWTDELMLICMIGDGMMLSSMEKEDAIKES